VKAPLTEPLTGRIRLAILALRISEGIYVLLGLCLPISMISVKEIGDEYPMWLGVCTALRRRQFWAWVAGLCISGLYIPSLFLPLGVMGLVGLLDPASRAAFGVGSKSTSGL